MRTRGRRGRGEAAKELPNILVHIRSEDGGGDRSQLERPIKTIEPSQRGMILEPTQVREDLSTVRSMTAEAEDTLLWKISLSCKARDRGYKVL